VVDGGRPPEYHHQPPRWSLEVRRGSPENRRPPPLLPELRRTGRRWFGVDHRVDHHPY
ncbi:hypothetical protein A2U01_0016538, partial [Trifolium medium]|nr:hypothetical protein [Trifolium medium]